MCLCCIYLFVLVACENSSLLKLPMLQSNGLNSLWQQFFHVTANPAMLKTNVTVPFLPGTSLEFLTYVPCFFILVRISYT